MAVSERNLMVCWLYVWWIRFLTFVRMFEMTIRVNYYLYLNSTASWAGILGGAGGVLKGYPTGTIDTGLKL